MVNAKCSSYDLSEHFFGLMLDKLINIIFFVLFHEFDLIIDKKDKRIKKKLILLV